MTEKKKRLSLAHLLLGLGILVAISFIILTLVSMGNASTDTAHGCTPWCFDACPWCWLMIDLAAVSLFGIIPFFLILKKEAEEIKAKEVPEETKHTIHVPHFHMPHLHLPRPHVPHVKHKKVKHGKQYDATVTLKTLMEAFAHHERVTLVMLKAKGLVHPNAKGYKVLLKDNEIMDRPLTVYASSFSAQAKAAIHAAGGKAIATHA